MAIKTLAQIGQQQSYTKPYPALVSSNMGNTTLKLTLSVEDFIRRSEVYNRETIEKFKLNEDEEAQREEKERHAKNLARYALQGLISKSIKDILARGGNIPQEISNVQAELQLSPYTAIQPIVTNLRDVKPDGSDLKFETPRLYSLEHPEGKEQEMFVFVMFLLSQKLAVVDGQHRRKAFELVLRWLEAVDMTGTYPDKGSFFTPTTGLTASGMIISSVRDFWHEVLNNAMTSAFVAIECHLGATVEQERQLFSDLNYRGLKVSKALTQDYDQADPVNVLVHELIEKKKLNFLVLKTDESDWHKDAGGQLRKDIHTVTSFAVLGKGTSTGASSAIVHKHRGLADKFWQSVQKAPNFGAAQAKAETVLAQPVVLKAIAKLAHELGHGKSTVRDEDGLKALWKAIEDGSLDFSHTNKIWGSLMLDPATRKKNHPGVENYVFVPAGTNLDAGTVDQSSGWVRYGAKHNDIYRRIGDLIRFQLQLKPRPEVTLAIHKSKINLSQARA